MKIGAEKGEGQARTRVRRPKVSIPAERGREPGRSPRKGLRKDTPSSKRGAVRLGRERVLVEFPSNLLERADQAAAQLEKNRSELIRIAVEKLLDGLERERFDLELASAYAANSPMNLSLAEEFAHVDREGL